MKKCTEGIAIKYGREKKHSRSSLKRSVIMERTRDCTAFNNLKKTERGFSVHDSVQVVRTQIGNSHCMYN